MPWSPADATRHDKQANTPAKRRKWAAIANAILAKTGDDVLAIKTANARTEDLAEGKAKPWAKRNTTLQKHKERASELRFMLQPRRRGVFDAAGLIKPEELAKYGIDPQKPRPGTSTEKTKYPKTFTSTTARSESLDRTPLLFERSVASLERQAKGIGRQLAQHKPWEAPAPGAGPIDPAHRLGLLRAQAGAEARIAEKGRAAAGRKETRKDEKEAETRARESQQRGRDYALSQIKDRKRRLAAAAASTPERRGLVASVDFDTAQSLLEGVKRLARIIGAKLKQQKIDLPAPGVVPRGKSVIDPEEGIRRGQGALVGTDAPLAALKDPSLGARVARRTALQHSPVGLTGGVKQRGVKTKGFGRAERQSAKLSRQQQLERQKRVGALKFARDIAQKRGAAIGRTPLFSHPSDETAPMLTPPPPAPSLDEPTPRQRTQRLKKV